MACAVVMFVRDGRPRRVVQCRSHPGFPLCKHNYWVASLKNSFNIETGISSIPDIKLIRTDTTLDLSQKAEKGMLHFSLYPFTYTLFGSKYQISHYGLIDCFYLPVPTILPLEKVKVTANPRFDRKSPKNSHDCRWSRIAYNAFVRKVSKVLRYSGFQAGWATLTTINYLRIKLI